MVSQDVEEDVTCRVSRMDSAIVASELLKFIVHLRCITKEPITKDAGPLGLCPNAYLRSVLHLQIAVKCY